ncbi:MAG: lipopolysaccharide biosynthesis protein [Syntrophomonadaceae bacterium]|nr:lipopolysaccharide biosynthesis protein [Syntrophomonadaceae bacterium]
MNDEITIDLKDYLRILGKWKWVIILITAVSIVTAAVLSWFVLPPVYQAKAVIQVIRGEQRPVAAREAQTLEEVVGTLSRLPQMTINTYVSQLKNQEVFQQVIKRLNLDQTLYTPAGLSGMVSAHAVRDTNLIEVQVQNTDPNLAANLANAISEEFMVFINENNQEQLGKSMELLRSQLESTDRELAAATENLRKFDAQPRSVEYLAEQMTSRLADLSNFRSQQIAAEVSLQQELAGKNRLEARLAQTPPVITITTKIEPPLDGSELSPGTSAGQVVTEEPNPAYDRITQELAARDVKITELQARVAAITATVKALDREITGLQAEIAGKRAERSQLQGSVDRLEATYGVLADNITRTQVIRSINIGDASLMVVAGAVTPTDPVKPRKMLNVAIAFLLGLMVSVFLVFLLEFLDNTIKTPADIERHLAVPVLGSIPFHEPRDSVSGVGKKGWFANQNEPVPGAAGYPAAGIARGETSATKE